jgi:hypothetical protein
MPIRSAIADANRRDAEHEISSGSQGAHRDRTYQAPSVDAKLQARESVCHAADRGYVSQYVKSLTIQRERRLLKLRDAQHCKLREELRSPQQVSRQPIPGSGSQLLLPPRSLAPHCEILRQEPATFKTMALPKRGDTADTADTGMPFEQGKDVPLKGVSFAQDLSETRTFEIMVRLTRFTHT